MFFCSCGNLWEHADHRAKWPGQCSKDSGLARAAAWYHSPITSGWLANIYCMTSSSLLPFISCELWEAILSIAQVHINPYRLFFHWTGLGELLFIYLFWRTFKSPQIIRFLYSKLSSVPSALRRKVQPLICHSTCSLASNFVFWRNTMDSRFPNVPGSVASPSLTHTTLHLWSETGTPPLKASLRLGQAHEIKCEKWDTSCHIGKQKRCHSDQRLQPSSVSQWALGIQEGEYLPFSSQQTTVTPMLSPEKLRIWKHRILAPDSRGAYQRSYGALYRDDRTISPWLAKLQGNHCHVHSVPNQPAPASIWHNTQNPDYWPNITPLHRNFLFLEAIKIVCKPLSHPLF